MNASFTDFRDREAARWYARLQAPDCSAADHAELERWCAADPANAAAYARARTLAAAVTRAAASNDRLKAMVAQARAAGAANAAAAARRRRRAVYGASAVAASVLAAVGIAAWLRPASAPEPAVTATQLSADNATRTVTLDDGSTVHVDVETSLEVRFSAAERVVVLENGRAMFDVAHDARRPFSVIAGNGTVTAIGTRFQVERSADATVVTLAEGIVKVTGTPGSSQRSERLTPGDELSISAREQVWMRRTVDVRAATSWSTGRLVFREERLTDAIREVNRYASVKVRIADESLAELPVSGNFVAGDSAAVVAAFAAVLPIAVNSTDGEITLTRRSGAQR